MIIIRIKEFIDHHKISISKFEKTIQTSDGTIRNAIKKGTEISSKWLLIISDAYPELNMNWLITGNGNMIGEFKKKSLEDFSIEEITTYIFKNKEEFKKNTVYNLLMESELKDKVIETLEEEKEKLLKKAKQNIK